MKTPRPSPRLCPVPHCRTARRASTCKQTHTLPRLATLTPCYVRSIRRPSIRTTVPVASRHIARATRHVAARQYACRIKHHARPHKTQTYSSGDAERRTHRNTITACANNRNCVCIRVAARRVRTLFRGTLTQPRCTPGLQTPRSMKDACNTRVKPLTQLPPPSTDTATTFDRDGAAVAKQTGN